MPMPLVEILLVFAAPYLLALAAAWLVARSRVLPPQADPETLAQNRLGRLTARQRRALLIYYAPELIFALTALLLALLWRPAGWSGAALRWGLLGMAVVRLGLCWPVWRDLFSGRVLALHGPLRKIQVGRSRALATEDGPFVVLPVEAALFAAHAAGTPATIFYTPFSKRVVALQSQP
ncbi:hypothetical protein [Kallotenue papyrolyticum]|uniref:hypothetical protein n=1 Tax=Kallotenue papyrolyticum TaxID=1325125 RepID=UPI000472926A|nr:hypothetical protein [Kallotenue papyrolyticum]